MRSQVGATSFALVVGSSSTKTVVWFKNGLALRVVERFQFLELFLDPVGHLPRHLIGGGAGPLRGDHHRLDREVRIFLAAEFHVGEGACENEDDHEVPDERTVFERPVGKIEGLHWLISWSILMAWPSSSLCTPATTTLSPGTSPSVTRTVPPSSTSPSIFTRRSDTFLAGASTIQTLGPSLLKQGLPRKAARSQDLQRWLQKQ